jgi:hypothetical protein
MKPDHEIPNLFLGLTSNSRRADRPHFLIRPADRALTNGNRLCPKTVSDEVVNRRIAAVSSLLLASFNSPNCHSYLPLYFVKEVFSGPCLARNRQALIWADLLDVQPLKVEFSYEPVPYHVVSLKAATPESGHKGVGTLEPIQGSKKRSR